MADRPLLPLQVYLDSSDFSVFANPRARTTEHEDLERTLLDLQAAGSIELRFSYVHVIEVAPTSQPVINVARDRFECIKRLCGRRCLEEPFGILRSELRAISSGSQADKRNLRRNDGYWFPQFDLGLPSVEEFYRKLFADRPRKARRSAEKLFFDGQGRLRRNMLQALIGFAGKQVGLFAEQYPLTPAAVQAVRDYFTGGCSVEYFERAIKESIADLSAFGDWYLKQWDKASALSASLRQGGEALRDALATAALRATELLGSHGELLNVHIRERLFREMLEEFPAMIAQRLSNGLQLPGELGAPSWQSSPSLMTLAHVAAHLGRQTSFVPSANRKPLASDMGDLSHVIYLPHVDIFRADGFAANVIRSAELPYPTKIVGKLGDLSATIEEALANL